MVPTGSADWATSPGHFRSNADATLATVSIRLPIRSYAAWRRQTMHAPNFATLTTSLTACNTQESTGDNIHTRRKTGGFFLALLNPRCTRGNQCAKTKRVLLTVSINVAILPAHLRNQSKICHYICLLIRSDHARTTSAIFKAHSTSADPPRCADRTANGDPTRMAIYGTPQSTPVGNETYSDQEVNVTQTRTKFENKKGNVLRPRRQRQS